MGILINCCCCCCCQGYPTCRGETTCPHQLSRLPRQPGDLNINGFLNFTMTQFKVNWPRVTQMEGCLECPRPYKWNLRSHLYDLAPITRDNPPQNYPSLGNHRTCYFAKFIQPFTKTTRVGELSRLGR